MNKIQIKDVIVFDDMIDDMINDKKLNSIVTELVIWGRKLYISMFLLRSHILRSQMMLDLILLTFLSHKFRIKENFKKLREIIDRILALVFINICREFTAKPYSFLVNDATLASDNPLRFRKILFIYNKNHDN